MTFDNMFLIEHISMTEIIFTLVGWSLIVFGSTVAAWNALVLLTALRKQRCDRCGCSPPLIMKINREIGTPRYPSLCPACFAEVLPGPAKELSDYLITFKKVITHENNL